jgi:cystathionine beta-lyase
MSIYDFDLVIPRQGTDALKWSGLKALCPARDGDIIPLWVADMDFAVLPAIQAALAGRVAHPLYGYSRTSEDFFQSFRNWMACRHDCVMPQAWIGFAPGIVPAIAALIHAVTGPGDGVVIMPPVYHPFGSLVVNNGRTLREAPLRTIEGRYVIDFEALERAAAGARLLLLCSPHNPVGRVWTRDELGQIADIAERHDLIVLADEIHADLVFRPHRHIPALAISEAFSRRLVSAWAPSKTFNIAGLQTSYTIIADAGLRRSFGEGLNAMGLGLPNCFGMAGAIAAYRDGGPWLDELLVYLHGNYTHLVRRLAEGVPAITVHACEGTYLAWLDLRALGLDGDVHRRLLDQAGLWLDAGSRFGTGGAGFARLNFGCPRSILDQAIERLIQAFG